ncbi:hypothetical protein FGO68_gene1661 [Halteria grandinella]|uniref:Uncharacterized protein n=1 Tax=Halteria grandinella TaxID=5974 RepID=A0A8J8P935_HALGN|nr:hypothetical protein FGO68_gene1661 [Halteria grandinella]
MHTLKNKKTEDPSLLRIPTKEPSSMNLGELIPMTPNNQGAVKLAQITPICLSNCLVKSQLLEVILTLPLKTPNHEIVRVCVQVLSQIMNYHAKVLA